MINEETVFILGAGASVPYGFPTAFGLREKICGDHNFAHTYINNIIANNFQKEQIIAGDKRFRKTFYDSQIKSIDSFLAINDSFNDIGKISIAYHILNYESKSKLSSDWLLILFNKMLEGLIAFNGFEGFHLNKVSFITFNYDRTLEQFLFNALANAFSQAPRDKITDIIKLIPIHHVYGSISHLPWQDNNGIEYGQRIDGNILKIAGSNLKTIYEINNDQNINNINLVEARTWIAKAKRIFVLGFGYDPENINILDFPNSVPLNTNVFGTAFGLEPGQIERAKECFFLPTRNMDGITIMDAQADCLKLLNNYL